MYNASAWERHKCGHAAHRNAYIKNNGIRSEAGLKYSSEY
nr:MAG TPA: hypothetical protein [Caudoviricetes sp.]